MLPCARTTLGAGSIDKSQTLALEENPGTSGHQVAGAANGGGSQRRPPEEPELDG